MPIFKSITQDQLTFFQSCFGSKIVSYQDKKSEAESRQIVRMILRIVRREVIGWFTFHTRPAATRYKKIPNHPKQQFSLQHTNLDDHILISR
jgi:hypothetical protein